jgi:tRNA (guanine37-N1)-methyltransferase
LPLRFDIATLFPDFFTGPFGCGVVGRALRNGIASTHLHDLRAFTHDRHRTVDDRPFGGGEGMVLKPEPVFECVESLGITAKAARHPARERVYLLSAGGRRFTQETARELAGVERIVLICGRYEGVDERVAEFLCDGELSVGDFVLSGGELGAAIIVDATVRLLPGVLGHADSARFESFGESDEALRQEPLDGQPPQATHGAGGLLDYPHYTRPPIFRGVGVPEVLAGGDHAAIRRWRREAALRKTAVNRPDLLAGAELSREEQQWLVSASKTGEESGRVRVDSQCLSSAKASRNDVY